MSSIDNRIVKMTMENEVFMKACDATKKGLNTLNDAIKNTANSKGFQNISKSARDVDLSPLTNSISSITNQFSMLDVIGVSALFNIANTAVSAGASLVKSLTIEPLMTGFQEYETKMGAIQTILTNTAHAGTTMDDVTAALDELNVYADKTIYNFAEMTRNIGTFTAAGVGLQDATIAIKGIANLAAGSGSTSQQASTAMYQLSQALASGKVNLQDWNSVVNAGMGGKMFQDALKETGRLMGANIDDAISFRDSISSKDGTGWLTSEILLETLKKFADDPALLEAATQVKSLTALVDTMKESVQSGWGKSWEYIFGNKMQAAVFFTSISQGFDAMASSMADYRNEALRVWNLEGGRDALIGALANITTSIKKVISPIYNAFKTIIDPWNGKALISLSKGFEWFTSKLIITDRASENISKTFTALFSVIKMVGSLVAPFLKAIGSLIGIGAPLSDSIMRVIGLMAGWVQGFVDMVNASGLAAKLANDLTWLVNTINNSLTWLLLDQESWFNKSVQNIKWFCTEMYGIFLIFKGEIDEFALYMKNSFMWFMDTYKPIEKAGYYMEIALTKIVDSWTWFSAKMAEIMSGIRKTFGDFVNKVKSLNIQAIDLVNVGLFGAIIVVAKKVFGAIKQILGVMGKVGFNAATFWGEMTGVAKNISGALDQLGSTLKTYQNDLKADILKKIALAVIFLAGAVMILSKVEPDRLGPAVSAIGLLLGAVMGSLWISNQINPKGLIETVGMVFALIGIALSLNLLASALKKLAGFKWDQILASMGSMAMALLFMSQFLKSLHFVSIGPGTSMAVIKIAQSMIILGIAFKIMSTIKPEDVMKSLLTMALALTSISLFMNSVTKITNPISVAVSLIPLALSMILFAGALAIFGKLKIETMQQGFYVLTITLALLLTFINGTRGLKTNMVSVGAGIILLGTAMYVLAGALAILGNMDVEVLSLGLMVMGGALLMIAGALNLMPKDTAVMASGILLMGIAMMFFSKALSMLSGISWESIGKGFVVLAGSMAILAGLSYVFAIAVPGMVAFAAGMAALGAACIVLSIGISAIVGSLSVLGISLTGLLYAVLASLPALGAALALMLVSFVTVLGYNAEALGRAMTSILQNVFDSIADSLPNFINMITVFLMEVMGSLRVLIPKLLDLLFEFLEKVLIKLTDFIPILAEKTFTLINAILDILIENMPVLATKGIELVTSLILSVLNGLSESIPKISEGVLNLITTIINTLGDNVIFVVNAAWDFVIKMINGLADSIETKSPQVREAIKRLINAMIDEFTGSVGDFWDIGVNIVTGMVNGVKSTLWKITKAAKDMATTALTTVKDWLGIHSPSREFAKLGVFTGQGMANGIDKSGNLVYRSATDMANNTINVMRSALESANKLLEDDINAPVITPVLDLSEIQNGGGLLDSYVNGLNSSVGVNGKLVGFTPNSNNANMNSYENTLGKILNTLNNSNSDKPIIVETILDGKKVGQGMASYNEQISYNRMNMYERGVIV